ncbi:Protein arginine N-methyltransferase 2 [Penicillium longicatenatum]|uniref:Protein arginine N-methyltransferase 2 n=1 Tax=Penicillium longicatenatum TaxID=1561947 RepID=UPI002548921D|nr:Protein arginine N-methyltransferase 2 [Penicillium longicatenatum]KAJ5657752.1 Protein arginine N-methyltransferase 2 [Penicillium longicatenatum]
MADPTNDPEISFTQIDVDLDVQEILLAASQHDIPTLRRLVRTQSALPNAANVKDPETGYSPLHAAIAACEPEAEEQANGVNGAHADENAKLIKSGVETVKFLLQEGAIWNDLDNNDETPGCIARRINAPELYELVVDAGVRAEMLLSRLEGYEELSDGDDEDEDEDAENAEAQADVEDEAAPELVDASETDVADAASTGEGTGLANPEVSNPGYLNSSLNITNDRILDADQNGVMMSWESSIMKNSAQKLLPRPGMKVLNVGHGMGIVDGFFQEQSPASHHIIEAHPDVVAEMKRRGWDSKPGVVIHEGRWQDIMPGLVGAGETFDAIYYDTFAESYNDFREFFSEQVIGLLEQEGKWGFFNGMGADRQISYDVYQKVAEMDLFEAGFDIDWEDIPVPKLGGEWEGVRRAYWVVDNYRLPLCRFMD